MKLKSRVSPVTGRAVECRKQKPKQEGLAPQEPLHKQVQQEGQTLRHRVGGQDPGTLQGAWVLIWSVCVYIPVCAHACLCLSVCLTVHSGLCREQWPRPRPLLSSAAHPGQPSG